MRRACSAMRTAGSRSVAPVFPVSLFRVLPFSFYMSPEQVMETQYNAKSDIWSLVSDANSRGRWAESKKRAEGTVFCLRVLVRLSHLFSIVCLLRVCRVV